MAEKREKPPVHRPPRARLGIRGALQDFIEATSRAVAPRAIVQRKARLQEQEDEAQGLTIRRRKK